MKDFQDNWAVSFAKDFQDNWNVSFMKNFQDNWNVSFMNDKANEFLQTGNEGLPRQLERIVHEELPG